MNDPKPAPLLRLESVLADRRALDREQFLAKHAEPVLVITLAPKVDVLEGDGAFRTQLIPSDLEQEAIITGAGITVIVPVVKRMADAFQAFIWVGRESRCDVSLPFSSVSKLQAQFIKRPDGGFDLLDAGSTNGTFVDGTPLEKNRRVQLREGALIRFGKIDARFQTSAGFWDDLGRST